MVSINRTSINVYQLVSNSITGNVLRFGSTSFSQLTYDIPLRSTRIMLDGALTVATWKKLSFYAKAGIGYAWNRVSYSDKSLGNSDCADQEISLNANNSNSFVWEAGLGLLYAANDHVGISFEYLYTDLGTVKTGGSGSSGTIALATLSAPSFNVRSQTALIGLHVAI